MTDPTQPTTIEPGAVGAIGSRPNDVPATSGPQDARPEAIEAVRTDPALRTTATGIDTPAEAQATASPDGRVRVQWVRPTDLAARAGAAVLKAGIDVNQRTRAMVREAAVEAARATRDKLRRALSRREQALTPDAPATTAAVLPVVGRRGVSR